jgi:hypothetical protein
MMRNATLVLGTLMLLACSRADRAGSTQTTGASTTGTSATGTSAPNTNQPATETTPRTTDTTGTPGTAETGGRQADLAREAQGGGPASKHADAVRAKLMKDRPTSAAVISQITIIDDGNDRIAIIGVVPDQQTKDALIKSAKATGGVKDVRDDLHVQKR